MPDDRGLARGVGDRGPQPHARRGPSGPAGTAAAMTGDTILRTTHRYELLADTSRRDGGYQAPPPGVVIRAMRVLPEPLRSLDGLADEQIAHLALLARQRARAQRRAHALAWLLFVAAAAICAVAVWETIR